MIFNLGKWRNRYLFSGMPVENLNEYQRILTDLRQKKFSPIYVFCGEEFYFIDMLTEYIEKHALNEAEKGFNQTVCYARDTEIKSITESARRFPMMANHQVIIVKEAQSFRSLDEFESYFEKPVPSTILVISLKGKKLDRRTKLFKNLSRFVYFESKKLYDNEVPSWVRKYLGERGYEIPETSALLIADSLGSDLSKISNELEKLIINKGSDKQITPEDIEKNIGISREFNIFELQSAICSRHTARAFHIGVHMAKSKDFSPIAFFSLFSNFISKVYILKQANAGNKKAIENEMGLNIFQARDAANAVNKYTRQNLENMLKLCSEFDMKAKGYQTATLSDQQLMKDFLVRLF